jgi:two-component system, OmpR family, phosphate regulon sensor histidine kinase PhoR
MSDRRSGLAVRLLVVGGLVAMALVILMMALVDRSIRRVWLEDLDRDLASIAAVTGAGLSDSDPEAWTAEVAARTGTRVTLIDLDGAVLADSHQSPETMENHATRPEVVAALAGEIGGDTRTSASTGFAQRYVAVPPDDGIVVRVSAPLAAIDAELAETRQAVASAGVVIAVVAIALLVLMGRRMARPVVRLADQAHAIAAGDLAVEPARFPTAELDRLGTALGHIAEDLGGRMREAEEASSTLEVVLGAIPLGTVLFEADDVAYSNTAAGEMLGVAPTGLRSMVPLQFQEAVREARASGEARSREVDHGIPARRLRAVATPLGEARVLLVIVDVTERIRIDAVRRDFVANASHELKTPVATMIASAEALQIALGRRDPSAERFASQLEGSARQLDRLVGDLLDLSRLEQEAPVLAPVRLDELVLEELARHRARIEDNGLTLDVVADPAMIMGDTADLRIAVRNLVDNAIRHTPEGGIVDVRVGANEDTVFVRVTDTGEGIPSADLSRIFERFYRVDSARSRDTGGTGLGLAIVRHVAESHGGRATVTSELGAGSVFTVTLPRHES